MSEYNYDLLVRAGRVICPASGFDSPATVAVRDGRIVACGRDVTGSAQKTFDCSDWTLLPGLVDMHAHPACGGSKYGINPDVELLPRGVTTVLSQGDAGASNWPYYKATTIDGCRTRVRLAINLSTAGESMPGGCLENLDRINVDACVDAIKEGGELIWGIAINASQNACGTTDPREVLKRGLQVAERTGRPILYGIRRPTDWSLAQQLRLLRPGDVLTYCFRGAEWSIVVEGKVRPEVQEARRRGVLFDVGHGMASFDFRVAETAIAQGFLPDSISTDQYRQHSGSQPQHDLPRTISKLIAIGMPQHEAFAAATQRPARMLGLDAEIGTLTVGACADLMLMSYDKAAAPLVDTHEQQRAGGCWQPQMTIRAGQVISPTANTVPVDQCQSNDGET